MNFLHPTPVNAGVYSAIETITPDLAAAYLQSNTHNRKLRAPHVDRLAKDITAGRWVINGATIVFDRHGALIDGQHRLAAIAKAGIAVEATVVRGVPDVAMQSIDSNIPRQAHDVIGLHGFLYARRITGAARMILSLRDETERAAKYTNAAMLEFLLKHPLLQDAAKDTDRISRIAPPSLMIAWLYLARDVAGYKTQSARALEVLESGIPSYSGDPIHVFRERIIRMDPLARNHPGQRMQLLWTLASAWNDFIDGRKLAICKIRKSPVKIFGVDYSSL